MASTAESARAGGPAPPTTAGTALDLVAQLVLSVAVALDLFLVALPVALLAGAHGEDLEWAMYIATFAVLLPAGLAGGGVLARRLRAHGLLAAAAAGLSTWLLAVLLLLRAVYAVDAGASTDAVLLAGALAGAAGTVAAARARSAPERLSRVAGQGPARLLALPAVFAAGLLLAGFPPSWVLEPKNLAGAVLAGAAAFGAYRWLLARRVEGRLGAVVDAAVVVAVFLVANDLNLQTDHLQFFDITSNVHQGFFLGPVNDVLHGRPMLVDTFSQYGAGLFYFLAGWFELGHVGYGGMTLLSGLLSAIQLVTVYAVMRLAGASRVLGFAITSVAVVGLFFAGSLPPPTSHPSVGGLRYLLPYLLIAAALVAERFGDRRPLLRALPAVLLGIAAVWSIETLVYCAAAFGGQALVRAGLAGPDRAAVSRSLLRDAAGGIGAVVAAHVAFALLVRAFAGDWPDWGGYLAYLGSYDVGGISSAPMQPWTPAFAIGAGFAVSIAALVLVLARAPAFARAQRVPLVAVAGMAAFGLASFTYFVSTSFPDVALLVGVPCYIGVGLWLTVLERNRERVAPAVVTSVLAVCFAALALLAVFTWPTIKLAAPGTPLATMLPGGRESFRADIGRLWRSDPVDRRYDVPAALVRRYLPRGDRALVVATSDDTLAILLQVHRSNVLPVANYLQESLVLDRSWPRVKRAIDRLPPGTRMITEPEALKRHPRYPTPLLQRTTREILGHWRLRFVAGNPLGYQVIELTSRRH